MRSSRLHFSTRTVWFLIVSVFIVACVIYFNGRNTKVDPVAAQVHAEVPAFMFKSSSEVTKPKDEEGSENFIPDSQNESAAPLNMVQEKFRNPEIENLQNIVPENSQNVPSQKSQNLVLEDAQKEPFEKFQNTVGKVIQNSGTENVAISSQGSESSILDSQILNRPSWVDTHSWGLAPKKFPKKMTAMDFRGGGLDQEAEIAWYKFFEGTTNGLVLELGAMNGKDFSASKFFEEKAGWKAILIEASPQGLEIPKNRPDALSLQLAVCEQESSVHFVNGADIGGILEFMTVEFLNVFHKNILQNKIIVYENGTQISEKVLDWEKVEKAKNIVKQPCLPLQTVFNHFGINHINFMVLDLEGGELSALKSLDFNKIEIDVLCVETNRFDNPEEPYIDQVVEFLAGKGYLMYKRISGRNTWFVSPNWKKF